MADPNQQIVGIIGRPNVGKSSLFNRFLGKRIAVVDDQPGVTRDRNYQICEWSGKEFQLADTGGLVPATRNQMEEMIARQVEISMRESRLLLLVVDAMVGIADLDLRIAQALRKGEAKNVILVANKAESPHVAESASEFRKLGMGDPFPVSATHGLGIGDLLDRIVEKLGPSEGKQKPKKSIRVAVVGRPNAGKSTFINRICGDERVLVHELPGTTRDAVDIPLEFEGVFYTLVDTAGMRKRARVQDPVEYYANLRGELSLQRCDVAIVMVDAEREVEQQDCRVIQLARDYGCGIVIALNKWDLVEKDTKTFDRLQKKIDTLFPDLAMIPKVTLSSLTGKRVQRALRLALEVYNKARYRVRPEEFHGFAQSLLQLKPPPMRDGRLVRIYSLRQTNGVPPSFEGKCSHPKAVKDAYTRYIRNRIVEKYALTGCPVRIRWVKASKRRETA